jgi:hypothetical protein
MALRRPRWWLAPLLLAACDGTPSSVPGDAAVVDGVDLAVVDPVEVAPEGFRVALGSDGRLRVESARVAVAGLDVVLRLADDPEHGLSSMTLTPRSAPGAVVGRAADGWSVAPDVAAITGSSTQAVRVSREVQGVGTVRGVELRSPDVTLPLGAAQAIRRRCASPMSARMMSAPMMLSTSPDACHPNGGVCQARLPSSPPTN